MIDLFECLIKMREAVETAVTADGLDRYIRDDQLFGGKVHPKLGDKVGQGLVHHFPDGAIDVVNIFLTGVYESDISFLEEFGCRKVRDGIVQPDRDLSVDGAVFGIGDGTEDKEQQAVEMDQRIPEPEILFRSPGYLPDQGRAYGDNIGQKILGPEIMFQLREVSLL